MSTTRHAEPGKPLRQERYASSQEFNRGLMANLVARCAALLDRPEDRELIWTLQYFSHRDGGLEKLAAELLAKYPERIGTASMLKFGNRPGRRYTAEEVRAVRAEIPIETGGHFLLRGEYDDGDMLARMASRCYGSGDEWACERPNAAVGEDDEIERKVKSRPTSYPARAFFDFCGEQLRAEQLAGWLTEVCLNPELPTDCGPWYFHSLVACLREFVAEWIESRRRQVVVTELGAQVYDTLDFTLESRGMTLIEGPARTGKTFATKAWCEQHPGQARYVELPATNDDIGFFRAIAKALGVSINLNSKAQELRQRTEEALEGGDIALVLDEAHLAWPQRYYHHTTPMRILWLMGLKNRCVPISLITTQQFFCSQKLIEKTTGWNSAQFIGRIGHYQKLPDSLSESDLTKVAESLLPEGDAKTIETLVSYAQSSAKYLAGIESAVCRARHLARKEGRERTQFSHVKRAIKENVIPSDSALAQALAEPPRRGRRAVLIPAEPAIAPPLNRLSSPVEAPGAPSHLNRLDRPHAGRLAIGSGAPAPLRAAEDGATPEPTKAPAHPAESALAIH